MFKEKCFPWDKLTLWLIKVLRPVGSWFLSLWVLLNLIIVIGLFWRLNFHISLLLDVMVSVWWTFNIALQCCIPHLYNLSFTNCTRNRNYVYYSCKGKDNVNLWILLLLPLLLLLPFLLPLSLLLGLFWFTVGSLRTSDPDVGCFDFWFLLFLVLIWPGMLYV